MKKGRKVGWFKKESQGCYQKKEQSYKTKNSKITWMKHETTNTKEMHNWYFSLKIK